MFKITRLIFVFLAAISFSVPALAAQTEKECGDVTVTMGGTVAKGKLVLRYLDMHGNFNAVFKFPYGKKGMQEALLSADPNPMLDNPLWQGIEACAGGPAIYDEKGNRIK